MIDYFIGGFFTLVIAYGIYVCYLNFKLWIENLIDKRLEEKE